MSVNMAGALPGGDTNGLGKILSKLIHEPDVVHIGVVLFDVSKKTENVDTGDIKPTIRVRAIEPITLDGDAETAQRLLRRAHEERTGQQQLPLDLEQAIDHWLMKVDTATGVITGPDDPAADTSEDGADAQPDPDGDLSDEAVRRAADEAVEKILGSDAQADPEADGAEDLVGDVGHPGDSFDDEMPSGPEWGDRNPEDGDQ